MTALGKQRLKDIATIVVIFLVTALVCFGLWTINEGDKAYRDRFMNECLADGKKRYECEALWLH